MSRIGGKNTTPEKKVRSALHKLGYRFRLHRKDLPGKPDICLPKYKTVVFVNGCYWHRHKGCKRGSSTPATNIEFWQKKFNATVKRDQAIKDNLEKLDWRVVTIWECEIKNEKKLAKKLEAIME